MGAVRIKSDLSIIDLRLARIVFTSQLAELSTVAINLCS
jgi:hypothetical protein